MALYCRFNNKAAKILKKKNMNFINIILYIILSKYRDINMYSYIFLLSFYNFYNFIQFLKYLLFLNQSVKEI